MGGNITSVLALLVIGLVSAFFLLGRKGRKTTTVPSPTPGPTPPESRPPIALPPFITGALQWKNQILIDFRYRDHGCDSATGEPLLVSGATDPDGGELTHKIEITGPTKTGSGVKKYAVFGITTESNGKTVRIDGDFVSFPWIRNPSGREENNALAACVVGNEKDSPGYPVVVKACPTPITTPPPVEKIIGNMEIRYTVRNSSGKTAEGLTRVPITVLDC